MKRSAFTPALFLGLAACGGSETAEMDTAAETPEAAPAQTEMAGEMTMPSWFAMDGNNVTLDIVAGQTDKGNYWNYNGAQFGEMTITVPVGANVTVNFSNDDPNMARHGRSDPGLRGGDFAQPDVHDRGHPARPVDLVLVRGLRGRRVLDGLLHRGPRRQRHVGALRRVRRG